MCCLLGGFVLCYGRQSNDFNVVLLTMIFKGVKRFRNALALYGHLINSLCQLLDLFSDSSLRRSKVVQLIRYSTKCSCLVTFPSSSSAQFAAALATCRQ